MQLQPTTLVPEPLPVPLQPADVNVDWRDSPQSKPTSSKDRQRSDRELDAAKPWWIGVAKFAGAIAIGTAMFLAFARSPIPSGDETVYPNWHQHVEPLNERFRNTGESVVKHVSRGGSVSFGTQLALSELDRDDATTAAVQAALAKGDVSQAEAALQAAQQIPGLNPSPKNASEPQVGSPKSETAAVPLLKPTLTEGMKLAVLTGDAKFHHLFLFDCCDEDGDMIEVLVNGDRFAIIPLTHHGATISVPVSASQATSLSIRGLHDGGGGVTVGCVSSSGTTYLRRMSVGETQAVDLVRQ